MSVVQFPEKATDPNLVRTFRGQTYRLVGSFVRARKRDGSEATILTWQSFCAQCGDSFTITTPAASSKFQPNRRCQVHKRPGQRVRRPES